MTIASHRWVMTAPGAPLQRRDFEARPGAGEVVVQIAGCGVCHTDLGYYYGGVRTNQPLPLTLGHEISGVVVATGDGAEAWAGKSVIVPAVLPCGECDLCRRGLGTICRTQKMPGNDIEGGFGAHIVVPGRGLCEVDLAACRAPASRCRRCPSSPTRSPRPIRRCAAPASRRAAWRWWSAGGASAATACRWRAPSAPPWEPR